MKRNRISLIALIAGVLFFIGCGETELTVNRTAVRDGTGDIEGPEQKTSVDFPEGGGQQYPYPEIIHQVFTPENDMWDRKCLVWQITWPEYAPGYDPAKIPTVFTINGALNSIEYLNNIDPQNTYNSVLSLYVENKIQRSADVNELIHVAGAPAGSMETVSFNDMYCSPKTIYKMATESPSDFQMYWQLVELVDEVAYESGDYIFFKLGEPATEKLYGAIVVASMSPRVVQVFLAVPNEVNIDSYQFTP